MIGIAALIDAVTSHAAASGFFDSVNGFEPKSAPGGDLTYAVWVQSIEPAHLSGLTSTSARVTLTGRLYKPFLSKPEDSIDPDMIAAVDALMEAYAGHFTLSANARNIDLQGSDGEPLNVRAGYQNVDKTIYRVMDITIPIIVNDAWTQGA
jgi:hypothetical protein